MSSSRQARSTRTAISPRLATSAFLNTEMTRWEGGRPRPPAPDLQRLQGEEGLAVLHRVTVLHQDRGDASPDLGLDLVHQLHGLDDADHRALLHQVSLLDEGLCAGRRSPVE